MAVEIIACFEDEDGCAYPCSDEQTPELWVVVVRDADGFAMTVSAHKTLEDAKASASTVNEADYPL